MDLNDDSDVWSVNFTELPMPIEQQLELIAQYHPKTGAASYGEDTHCPSGKRQNSIEYEPMTLGHQAERFVHYSTILAGQCTQ
jgi:hypothetical protein